jgi:chloramphenicol-sensitive protein RarD
MTTATDPATPAAPSGDTMRGFLFALAAYLFWGVLPLYMKLVGHLPTLEVLSHRVIWSVPIALVLLVWLGRTADIRRALRSPKTLLQAAVAAAFVSVNWGLYVWAISVDRALETALGYYINPLLTVLLGAVMLGEKLSRAQVVAIGFALAAVAVLTWEAGGLPWVSLGLAFSWAMYAFFKRTLPVGPAQGFFLEVLILLLPALAFVFWLEATGRGHAGNVSDALLLVGCGLVTAVPLIVYATGAKLLTLSTIGIMQYIAPTIVFVIAVFVFGEPFSGIRLFAFVLIWIGLAIYTWSFLAKNRPAPA